MIKVQKRDGTYEDLSVEKINNWVEWACRGTDVSWTEIVTQAHVMFYDGIKTQDIMKVLIKQCEDSVTEYTSDLLIVAARLLLAELRKQVYGEYTPRTLIDQIWFGTEIGIYDSDLDFNLLENYSFEELIHLEDYIDHSRDELIPYGGLVQLMDKYLTKDRGTGAIYETPQYLFMLIAMTGALNYPSGDERLRKAELIYDKLSYGKINLPTPVAAGMRTPLRQYASCCLIDLDDTMPSIGLSDHAAFTYTGARAGLGLNYGRIRREGAKIRHGEVSHTGLIPFLKKSAATSKSCTQNGVRGGGGTVNIPIWHYDFESLVVLKNVKGEEANRVRTLDYCWHYNGYLLERLKTKGNITLFSPHEVKDLYEAFYADQSKFAQLYEKYENDSNVSKRSISAIDLFSKLAIEKQETGRQYTLATDHVNNHSSFLDTIYMTNLCVEITLPTSPIKDITDISPLNPNMSEGEIALCVLGGIPWGNIDLVEMQDICMAQAILLDRIFDIQDYHIKAAEHAKYRRSIAVGIIDYAHFLAKNECAYGSEKAIALTHLWMEHMQYYMIKAAVQLAKERGPCEYFQRTKYAKGILPIDTYCKNVDKIHPHNLTLDWDTLRKEVVYHGMRFSTLTGHMPSESSSVTWGYTNGIEPPKKPITVKSSKAGDIVTIIPDVKKHIFDYTYTYDSQWGSGVSNDAYLKTAAIIQKFSDQSISYNHYHDYRKQEKIAVSQLLMDFFIKPHYYGIKTTYYANSNVEATQESSDSGCASGACTI